MICPSASPSTEVVDCVQPLLSIVTIVFRDLPGLQATRSSIETATIPLGSIEWIVVDGGSEDGTREWLAENFDLPGHWVSERDKGIYDAMNKGVAMGRGRYVVMMNGGDRFAPGGLAVILADISAQGRDIHFYAHLRGDDPTVRTPLAWTNHVSEVLPEAPASHQATIYQKKLHARHGEYSRDVGICADLLFLFRVCEDHSTAAFRSDAVTAIFDPNGISSNPLSSLQSGRKVWRELGWERRYRRQYLIGPARTWVWATCLKLKHLFPQCWVKIIRRK